MSLAESSEFIGILQSGEASVMGKKEASKITNWAVSKLIDVRGLVHNYILTLKLRCYNSVFLLQLAASRAPPIKSSWRRKLYKYSQD